MNTIVELAKEKYHLPVQKLATTGVAAFLINGETVHHFLKMDIECTSYLEKGSTEYALVKNCKLVVIDEFTLIERVVFEAVDKIFRLVTNNLEKPFGGKHIILMGDPAQLPAIDEDIFDCPTWRRFDILMLEDVKRQSDPEFLKLLSNARMGVLDEEDIALLKSRIVDSDAEIMEPVIVSLRKERDLWNTIFLNKHVGEEFTFQAIDTDPVGRELSKSEKEKISKCHRERFVDVLKLKVGAKVLLLKNIAVSEGWVNGTLATVKLIKPNFIVIQHSFLKKTLVVTRVRQNLSFPGGIETTIRKQFPLILGWALTVHKVQGMTLTKATIDLSDSFFASGQAYVALSRVKCLSDLHLVTFSQKAVL